MVYPVLVPHALASKTDLCLDVGVLTSHAFWNDGLPWNKDVADDKISGTTSRAGARTVLYHAVIQCMR